MQYLQACDSIGDYYYQKNNYSKALHYYLKVANLYSHADGELEEGDKLLTYHNKVSVKAGNMFYSGFGTKKNRNKANFYHNPFPNYLSKRERDRLSILEFKTTKLILAEKPVSEADTVLLFAINPFYISHHSDAKSIKKSLHKYSSFIEKKLLQDSSRHCIIYLSRGNVNFSEAGISSLNNLIDLLDCGNSGNADQRLDKNLDFENENTMVCNGISLPTFKITFKGNKAY